MHEIENKSVVLNTTARKKEVSTTNCFNTNEQPFVVIIKFTFILKIALIFIINVFSQFQPYAGVDKKRSQRKSSKSKFDSNGNSTGQLNVEQFSLAMKHMPSKDMLVNAEQDPTCALMALATNSGLGRFLDSSQLIREWDMVDQGTPLSEEEKMPSYIRNLMTELCNNVTTADHGRIFEEFQHHWNLTADLVACASCGMKSYQTGEERHHIVSLNDVTCLQISTEYVQILASYPQQYRYSFSYFHIMFSISIL